MHIFDRRLVFVMSEGLTNLRLPTLVFMEYGFSYFAWFSAHFFLLFRGRIYNAQGYPKFLGGRVDDDYIGFTPQQKRTWN